MTTPDDEVGLRERGRRSPFRPARFVVPGAVGAIQLFAAAGVSRHTGVALPAIAVVGLAVTAAALLWRRRRPVAVLFFVLVVTFALDALWRVDGPIFLALIVAFVSAVLRGHRAPAVAALVLGYVGFTWVSPLVRGETLPGAAHALGAAAWLLVVFAAAEAARGRRERASEYRRRRREEGRRRASEERLRIAQELHDVLAHNISLINVQAGVALHLMDEQPEQARSALTAIKQASNEALGELRSVLDILRQRGEDAPRVPTSGLADLDHLVERHRAAGLDVAVQMTGTPRPLPPGVDLAAYRIVQESLTNVTRHADVTTATVVIDYADEHVSVRVDDAGHGGAVQDSDGNGIAGMTERAAALGGTLTAGPRPSGGFSVSAVLPLAAARDSAL